MPDVEAILCGRLSAWRDGGGKVDVDRSVSLDVDEVTFHGCGLGHLFPWGEFTTLISGTDYSSNFGQRRFRLTFRFYERVP